MTELERHAYDVVVIGAGGAGLRAAIEAREHGLRTAIVCKSLFGKAHTVMAEGGIAAAMGNSNAKDNWQVHFRDTMRGGKFLNNPRMAELHALEAPQRVWELETYGALLFGSRSSQLSGSRRPFSAIASMSPASASVTTSASMPSITERACLPEPPCDWRTLTLSLVLPFQYAAKAALYCW